MTTTDLRAILESRRAQWSGRLADHRKIVADGVAAIAVAEAHLQELDFALEQLPAVEAPPSAAPVPEAAPPAPEKFPRDQCAALIIEDYEGHPLPENIDGLTPIYAETWNPRTLRAGLELAKQRRQQSAAKHAESPRRSTAAPEPERVEAKGSPPAADQTTEPDMPEIPPLLRREKAAAE